MKYVLAIFIVVSVAVSSNQGNGSCMQVNSETDSVIYSDVFNQGDMAYHAPYACSTFCAADDFTPASNSRITDISFWIFSTRPPLPSASELNLSFYTSGASGPGDSIWAGEPASITITNTGVHFAIYFIFEIACKLDTADYVDVSAGQTYWAGVTRTSGGDMYTIMDTNVTGSESWGRHGTDPWYTGSSLGQDPVNMFLLLEDNSVSAFQESSWGAIKAAQFQ